MTSYSAGDVEIKEEFEIFVSVIVLTYNHARFIRQALDSVLMQKTDFSYEIIVGDDCSDDGTQEILTEYQSRFPDIFHVILREKNIGATQNLYDILMRAKGKYIASVEGDDFWTDREKLQIQVSFLECHSEYIGCSHDCAIINEDGTRHRGQRLSWICDKDIYKLRDFKGYRLPGQAATLIYYNIFFKNPEICLVVKESHPLIADRTIGLLLACRGDIYRIRRCMSCYRKISSQNGTNATSLIFYKKLQGPLESFLLTCRLESLASSQTNKHIRFTGAKLMFYSEAVLKALIYPLSGRWTVVAEILKSVKYKPLYIIYTTVGIVYKVICKAYYLINRII